MNNDPTLVPSYRPLTEEQIQEIETCIDHCIDLPELRQQVRAIWPNAIAVEITAACEYDDGSSYYWRCAEISVLDAGGVIPCDTPEAKEALENLKDDIDFGGTASGEDGDDTILLHLDTPTLDQLFQLNDPRT